jgi:hypothetical protein
VMNRVKSPSVAAAEICAKARTCEVRLEAMMLTLDLLVRDSCTRADSRDFPPTALNILNLGLNTQLAFRAYLPRDSGHFSHENG